MNCLRLVFLHSWFLTLELLRQPMYVITTVVFPSMFFWFFAAPNAKDEPSALMMAGSFCAFAVLGVVVFQFAVGIAQERLTPWAQYLRVLPAPTWVPFVARLVAGLVFAVFAVAGVITIAFWTTPFDLEREFWLPFISRLFLTGIPFGALGIFLGYAVTPGSALPVANLVHLPLSFAGGLWLPPNALPQVVQDISPYLPTRMYGELIWSCLLQTELEQKYLWGLIGYGAVFFLLAFVWYLRAEAERYG
ncbi:MAG: ABC transporter permease [Bdellovibrionaceae bacterium]|nr:ABC transporter permease [Pseudobdellovibrionaceae bacterium]